MPFFLERYAQAYLAELETFANGIRNKEPFSPNFEDGVIALELANAAVESAASGRAISVAPIAAKA